jgi:rubrerythrin
MEELIGIAMAIETEAVARYRQLAEAMRQRGDTDTARAFEDMVAEEESHIGAVRHLAALAGCPDIRPGDYVWRLPEELNASWETVSGSAMLTAYRALSIAVDNEQRAFSFYVFIAAEADDPKLVAQAERLACEELGHAALLRRWRRVAYRKERGAGRKAGMPTSEIIPETMPEFEQVLAGMEETISTCHAGLAERLERLSAPEAAVALRQFVGHRDASPAAQQEDACHHPDCAADRPLALLIAAQRPLEEMADLLERAMVESPDEAVRDAAVERLEDTVAKIALLGRLVDKLSPGVR